MLRAEGVCVRGGGEVCVRGGGGVYWGEEGVC